MNDLAKMTADTCMEIKIVVRTKTSIIIHTQTAHKEVSWMAINAKFKKTGDDSPCNVENSLVKCDQKVDSNVAMTEFKKTGEDSQCNVESPHVELDLRRQTRAVCVCWPPTPSLT